MLRGLYLLSINADNCDGTYDKSEEILNAIYLPLSEDFKLKKKRKRKEMKGRKALVIYKVLVTCLALVSARG